MSIKAKRLDIFVCPLILPINKSKIMSSIKLIWFDLIKDLENKFEIGFEGLFRRSSIFIKEKKNRDFYFA